MKIVKDMLDGIMADLGRTRRVEEARSIEPVAVRLVPQVPLRDGQQPRSWLGGAPALSRTVAWPKISDRSAHFLAQICCADLPADLWDGLGPRTGWLAFFIHPANPAVTALHVEDLGPWRIGPDLADADEWFFSATRITRPPLTPLWVWPRWSVDLVAVRPGGTDPQKLGRSQVTFEGYDVASPAHRPFDRTSALEMLALIEAAILGALERIAAQPSQLAKSEAELAASEAAGNESAVAASRKHRDSMRNSVEMGARRGPVFEAALPAVRLLIERVRSTPTLTETDITSLMNEVRGIMVPNHEGVLQSLTVHTLDFILWAHTFEGRRLDLARIAYCADPQALPDATREHFEAMWLDMAAREMASMGHVPLRYVGDYEPDTDVTLLELPSSRLIGWCFHDASSLHVSIKKRDLAAGRFDRLMAQITN